ncbi:Arm DNA-binding domain-containing protein [Thermosynechococcaceae cyanobacterium BACA0444]|uniref:Arm DNA-binding domain-containing protein n=1 Tax=Pseudocalidococcus azoricus BACA0444 TaxID=2918990 RepID=A0AAE4FRI5_9CYAN|nr:Arm DNA-binding domain-containing protein [Pseudocalidococcus azoricus BACA0444]
MLTELAIRKAKPTEKPQKPFDGSRLFLEVPPKENKRWRLKYRY